MIITCQNCHTEFALDDKLLRPHGTKVRCSRCKNKFRVYPEKPVQENPAIDTALAEPETRRNSESGAAPLQDSAPESEPDFDPVVSFNFESEVAEDFDAGSETDVSEDKPLSPEKPNDSAPVEFSEEESSDDSDSAKMVYRYTPFKRKLVYFACAIIGLIGIIVIPIEIYRPIQQLHRLIDNAKNLLGAVQASVDPDDLDRMNTFALDTILHAENQEEDGIYYVLSLNLLLLEGHILPEKEILTKLEYLEDFEGDFDYSKVVRYGKYWEKRFAADPGILTILKNYKRMLVESKKNADLANFQVGIVYIMLDTGKKEGFFNRNIAYILDSIPWWNMKVPCYTGEASDVTDYPEWREAALKQKERFDNNPIFAPENYYLWPRFESDEWGTWFSVWLTKKNSGLFNIYTIDFNAKSVKKLMLTIAALVLFYMIILGLVIFFVTKWLSNLVTRPITELTKGSQEISKGNYNYEVPVLQYDEFGELIAQFNRMTRGQKERLNLMQTLEKFLSKELAEKAAVDGLVVGGMKANCTVMFTDFAGFSTITQKMSAVETVNVLNAYFKELIPIIKKYGGFPDKYIGDAIVALFGAPVRLDDHTERAVACAIEMQWKMREINKHRQELGKAFFEMRIGLNTGEVIAGAIGCDMKLEYTSIGETTNLANRMESICPIGHIMVAEGTYNEIKNVFFKGVDIAMTPQRVQVKGYPKPVACYRIYVDNMTIEKDMKAQNVRKNFYVYHEADVKLKYSPDEMDSITFVKEAKFL